MKKYDPKHIEPKWQQIWTDTHLYQAVDSDQTREKYYMLTEFPYPSGDGLHAGHAREYTLGDVIARHKRMQGYNVLYPMGYDAFGLPTENYAIKHKIKPQEATAKNVATFRRQLTSLGYSIDWDREIITTDPDYYKWTQWLFLQFYKAGLAYQAEMPINWCPHCKTGLANEEVVNGTHERCGTAVEKRQLKQWLFKITAYADRLIDGLKTIDFPPRIADQQINWIGRSEGAEIDFIVDKSGGADIAKATSPADSLKFTPKLTQLVLEGKKTNTIRLGPKNLQAGDTVKLITRVSADDTRAFATAKITHIEAKPLRDIPIDLKGHEPYASREERLASYRGYYGDQVSQDTTFTIYHFEAVRPIITVYTTRPDTLAGATFLVLAPEHAAVAALTTTERRQAVETYIKRAQAETEIERTAEDRPKTGVFTGAYTTNPLTGRQMPIFVADYVLAGYGTGAIMAVPAHDERDYSFVTAMREAADTDPASRAPIPEIIPVVQSDQLPMTALGTLINSGDFNGLEGTQAKRAITKHLYDAGIGRGATKYRLRDWIFSRQHYWGEPIPIIHCPADGAVPVPESQLPVTLPDVESYEPTDTGESPLAAIRHWVDTTCPQCGGPAGRETDTMPNWAGSSWYYLRYMDPHNSQAFADPAKLDYWGSVDLYLGGMEHTTLHLLYSRFWHQFLHDQGLVPTPEPYAARRGQGIVLAADGRKMSKSLGNVVNPTDIIDRYGADTFRLYILFMAPYDETTPWSDERLNGVSRFVYKAWTLAQDLIANRTVPSPESAFNTGEIATAIDRVTHKTIKRVHDQLHDLKFNLTVSALMEYVNYLNEPSVRSRLTDPRYSDLAQRTVRTLILLLAPLVPHLTEELWRDLGEDKSVHIAAWPQYDSELIKDDILTIVVQVNGKVRANITATPNTADADLAAAAQADPKVATHLKGKTIVKTIVVPRKVVNFVVK